MPALFHRASDARARFARRCIQCVLPLLLSLGCTGAATAQAIDLFISEYVEGSSNNRAIEIYNGTTQAINLAGAPYRLAIYRNGASSPSSVIDLVGTIPAGGRWVVVGSGSSATLLARANQTASNARFNFNGDDAITLTRGATAVVVDAFGQVGFDPGTAWTSGGVTTVDSTLVRKPTVCSGDTTSGNAFNPSLEWTALPVDTFTNLGQHASDCVDLCPNDPNKTLPGFCGCGVPDTDSDSDGTPDCFDGCPNDPTKIEPDTCGCGVPESDADGDGTPDCVDGCPNDPAKTAPGACGCGSADADSDGDGLLDCNDGCPNDPAKSSPGACGCGIPDTDSDGDGTANCNDACPNEPARTAPAPWYLDADGDGFGDPSTLVYACTPASGYIADAGDLCPTDPLKQSGGACGCGVADTDSDGDGTPDCNETVNRLLLRTDDLAIQPGDPFTVRVDLASIQDPCVGAQFSLRIDTTRVEFISMQPAADGPFQLELYESADPTSGQVYFVQGVADGAPPATSDGTLANMTLRAKESAAGCAIEDLVRFVDVAPYRTLLTDSEGVSLALLTTDLQAVDLDGTLPTLVGLPPNWLTAATSPAGASVVQPSVIVVDDCDAAPALSVSIALPGGGSIGSWPASGVFPIGVSTVTWTGTDAAGNSVSDSRTVTVFNTAPTVAISSPAPGASSFAGNPVTFAASASDPEQGDISATITWTSSIQGALGTGAQIVVSNLVIGTHLVTASATDVAGVTASASVSISILDPNSAIPAAPSNPSISATGSVVTFRWTDNSSNESGFEIKRQARQSSGGWGPEVLVGSVGANTTVFIQSPGPGRFRYAVRAVNAAGASSWTGWVQVNVN